MKRSEFIKIMERRICLIRDTLDSKAKEYATDADYLANFRVEEFGGTELEAAWGYLLKHLVSIRALCLGREATPELIDEKIGDAVNYLILIEALFHERR